MMRPARHAAGLESEKGGRNGLLILLKLVDF